MSYFQTYIGSAFSSYPVRWIESSPASERTASSAEKPSVERSYDPDAGKPKSESGDVLDISAEAKVQSVSETAKSDSKIEVKSDELEKEADSTLAAEKKPSGENLTPEEQKQIQELKARDQEVRVHEAAHVSAGGAYVTGGPSYTYQTGPDGNKYAIGGEVGIDTSPVSGDPQATIQKMQTVAAAALAPAEPSGQDQKVAAAAKQAEAKARAELAQQSMASLSGESEESDEASAETSDSAQGSDQSSNQKWTVAKRAASPGSSYRAQSAMPLSSLPSSSLSSPRFSAFA